MERSRVSNHLKVVEESINRGAVLASCWGFVCCICCKGLSLIFALQRLARTQSFVSILSRLCETRVSDIMI